MADIGTLVISLTAQTAEFKEQLSKVEQDLQNLKDRSQETGEAMDHSFTESRGGLMLVEESVGVRLPRHLNTLIAQIPGVGAAFAVMLPIAGVALAIEIVAKLIEKHKELADKLEAAKLAHTNFATVAAQAMDKWQDKMLEVGIKSDDLAGKHLDALKKQLVLIDHQSMAELSSQFNSLAEAADKSLSTITEHWYESKIGVDGVRAALNTFKAQYAELLAEHKNKEAGDLLAGTLQSALKMKELMEAQQGGHGSTQSDLDAQNALVALLQTEVNIRKEAVPVIAAQKKEATDAAIKSTLADQLKLTEENKTIAADLYKGIIAGSGRSKDGIESMNRALHQTEDYFQAVANAAKKSAQEELSAATQSFANQGEVAKSYFDSDKQRVSSAAALGLITRRQAIQDEIALLQQEAGVKEAMLIREVNAKRAAIEAEIEADQRAASQTLSVNGGDKSDPKYIAYLTDAATKQAALNTLTEKFNADMKAVGITTKTQVAQMNTELQTLKGTFDNLQNAIANDIAKSIVMQKSLSAAFRQTGEQMAEGMLKNLLLIETTNGRIKFSDAKTAASNSYKWASAWGGPVAGAIAGALAFTSVMAFEQGGEIPGTGAVPIIGHGGETVVTKALTDRVEQAESRGGSGGDMHMHATYAPQIHAVDADGVERMLKKHAATFHREFRAHVRKMNR